ncbi:MAG: cadherin-like domain-containing protein [Gemmataceae bacterium]
MEHPHPSQRVQLDELFLATPGPKEPLLTLPFPHESGCELYGAPPVEGSGIELPVPRLGVLRELEVRSGDCVLLGPDVLQLTGPPPVLIDLVLVQLPQHGTLLRDGFALQLGDLFTQEDINCGRIRYRNEGGSRTTDSFVFTTPAGEIPPTPLTIVVQEPTTSPATTSDSCSVEASANELIDASNAPPSENIPMIHESASVAAEQESPMLQSMLPQLSQPQLKVAQPALKALPTHERVADQAAAHPSGPLAQKPIESSVVSTPPLVPEPTKPPPAQAPAPQPPQPRRSTALPGLRSYPPETLPSLPPPWRVSFRVEAVCGTGLALVRLEGAGVWQYSRDEGETWHDVGRVYHGRARLMRSTDRLRFVPYRGATGRVVLGARAWYGQEPRLSEYASLASKEALASDSDFGAQLLQLRWTLDR